MLHRIIYASESVGPTGASILSIAEIVGVSAINNRRDQLTSCVVFHDGHILQAVEGARADLDRLMRRLLADSRHTGLRVLSDSPIRARRLDEPMAVRSDPGALMRRLGLACLSRVTADEAETLLDLSRAA